MTVRTAIYFIIVVSYFNLCSKVMVDCCCIILLYQELIVVCAIISRASRVDWSNPCDVMTTTGQRDSIYVSILTNGSSSRLSVAEASFLPSTGESLSNW